MRRAGWLVLCLVVLVAVGRACAARAAEDEEPNGQEVPESTEDSVEAEPPDWAPLPAMVVPEGAEAALQAAAHDLMERLGREEAAFEVVEVEGGWQAIGLDLIVIEVEERIWPDTSLGCPEPGRLYAQVLTPGYRIVLGAGDERYVYHTSNARAVFCPGESG